MDKSIKLYFVGKDSLDKLLKEYKRKEKYNNE